MIKMIVGDPHAKVADLPEMEIFIDFLEREAIARGVTEIVLTGDLFDTHDIIRLRVIDFWDRAIRRLAAKFKVTILGGNHDAVGDNESEWKLSSLNFLKDIPHVRVITEGFYKMDGFDYIPYTHSEEKFKKAVEDLKWNTKNKVLVTHQAYEGGQYDNGMYIPDGFKLDTVAHYTQVLNGHIHTKSTFGNIYCVGSPRWQGKSDANQEKGVHIWEKGKLTFVHNNMTPKVVSIEVKEGEENLLLDVKDKNYVTLVGSSKWIGSVSKLYKGIARTIPKPTDSMTVNKKQSYASFKDFLTNQKLGVNIDDVIREVENA